MMVRLLRSGKWEFVWKFVLSSLLSAILGAAVWTFLNKEGVEAGASWAAAVVFLLVSLAFGYWVSQTTQRRIDALQLSLKQLANGNYEVRLPVAGELAYMELHREFNELARQLEERMKWLQKIGEEQIMQEAASNEAAVMEERKRLARDLHDTVSQQLFAIHMSASSLPKLQQLHADKAAEVLQQLIHMSTLAQKQMRGFIAQLRPMELENRTLQEALEKWFPDYCRQNGLQGELDWRIGEPLSEAKEHQLFLIAQEAMANVVKHARASGCTLTLAENERQVVMTVQDNGAGFRADEVKRGSYGLSTMLERAQKLGGTAEIMSKPGSGTRVKVTIPKIWKGDAEDGK
ncbi:sensor histidine kinase [Paenibacillus protaetiae]|uniref:Oxygen sensor histidine kinase NreB n=1 Tax=Paenibacillus protaetiae TaxID=2509456 RepID=A0A4P6EWP8_9BACL|nr:sensor histidine kinase [Paenibacillus protaetiae]QAY65007.1 sensor histidine kinase [Paenibacillus protaetiae]